MKEEYLLSSKLEKTNEMYALAKISGLKLCSAYNREYGTDYISVMPCNLYGLNDNYDLKNAHVLPMLVRRFHEAKVNNQSEVVVWGTGMPKREFMYAGDLAKAVVFFAHGNGAVLETDRNFHAGIGFQHLHDLFNFFFCQTNQEQTVAK